MYPDYFKDVSLGNSISFNDTIKWLFGVEVMLAMLILNLMPTHVVSEKSEKFVLDGKKAVF